MPEGHDFLLQYETRDQLAFFAMSQTANVPDAVRLAVGTTYSLFKRNSFVDGEKKSLIIANAQVIELPMQPDRSSSGTQRMHCMVNLPTWEAFLELRKHFGIDDDATGNGQMLEWCINCTIMLQSAIDNEQKLRIIDSQGEIFDLGLDKKGL